MILDLAKRLNKQDSSLTLEIGYDGNLCEMNVNAGDIGTIYSYSSTSIEECYSKVSNFINCLRDSDKFDELVKDVLENALEV